jgi:hypothetical protein
VGCMKRQEEDPGPRWKTDVEARLMGTVSAARGCTGGEWHGNATRGAEDPWMRQKGRVSRRQLTGEGRNCGCDTQRICRFACFATP